MEYNAELFEKNFFPLNHCYALLMWTYLLYFNLLSIEMIDFIRCWKNTCQ